MAEESVPGLQQPQGGGAADTPEVTQTEESPVPDEQDERTQQIDRDSLWSPSEEEEVAQDEATSIVEVPGDLDEAE